MMNNTQVNTIKRERKDEPISRRRIRRRRRKMWRNCKTGRSEGYKA